MSLLSVTVKKARYVGIPATQYNTYVTLKLQNVKSTTVTVKGPTPSWEQDFLFEINDINLGLLVEVWNKGVIWDRALGYHYLPLASVAYNEQECGGRWIELEAQLMMRGGAVVGTTGSTGHALLLDCRFEQPFDAEGTAGADLQRKLDLLNGALDAERAEQARRQMQYIAHSGYSEDSDYTSDLNYPVGQHPNCSASQFRNAAHQMHTPQRSLEVSRENSYEREEYHLQSEADPLYYNSQPRSRIETWTHYNQSELHAQPSIESAVSWRTAADWQSEEDQRRPSLERQNTLYDEMNYSYEAYVASTTMGAQTLHHQQSFDEFYDTSSYGLQNQYGMDQWDPDRLMYEEGFGLTPTEYENIMNKRRSSIIQLPQVPLKQYAASSRYSDFNGMTPYKPRGSRVAASLPTTPSSTPKRSRALPVPPGSGSETGSIKSGRGRRLPKVPYASSRATPQLMKAEKIVPDVQYGYDGYGLPKPYQEPIDRYQDINYSTTYDEDGMQPFFDETPHATPPAAQKPSWNEPDSLTQFTYPVTSADEIIQNKSLPTTISSYKPQDSLYSEYDSYIDQEQHKFTEILDNQYQDKEIYDYQNQYHIDERKYEQEQKDLQNQQQSQILQSNLQNKQSHLQQQHMQQQQSQILQQQQQQQTQILQQQQTQYSQQQKTQAQPAPPAQQFQASVMTGAATLGSFMAGGAKKLGNFFGAAAAAVGGPVSSQPSIAPVTTVSYMTTASHITPYTTSSTISVTISSVPEVPTSVPVSTTSAPTALPRTPSLKRQDTILRPPVHRNRTLPEAPEDYDPEFDESLYDGDYDKTEYEQTIDRDRTSLDRYREDEYMKETLKDDTDNIGQFQDNVSILQKTASPTRNGSQYRKPSIESYHSGTAPVDRRTSQSSFKQDEKVSIPVTTQEETITEKSKVVFKDERTTYHEVPDQSETYREESFDQQDDFHPDDETYHEDEENYPEDKFNEQEMFNENEFEKNREFEEERKTAADRKFQEEQPKLTPKQRWHRAYNKIVMQLNVSTFTILLHIFIWLNFYFFEVF